MAQGTILRGGNPYNGLVPVKADDVSILGNGTTESPLSVNPDAITVHVDDVTIAGDGSSGDPLHVLPLGLADRVPVLADGTTLVGDGTTLLPLTVVTGGGGGAVITDGTTIGGFGTVMVPLTAIFSGFDDKVAVAVDGTTVSGTGKTGAALAVIPAGLNSRVQVSHDSTLSGNGTSGSPLSVVSGAGTPRAFTYTVTGAEPDLANITVPLPATRSSANYLVWGSMQSGTNFLGAPQYRTKTTTNFVLALQGNATAGDVFAFYVVDAF